MKGISCVKGWPPAAQLTWATNVAKGFPRSHKARVSLLINGDHAEGCFVALEYLASTVLGGHDKLYMTFLYENAPLLAVHVDGPSRHMNKVGEGEQFYQRAVGHPHIHLPVKDASWGYVEPVNSANRDLLWQTFLNSANIQGAPALQIPETSQMVLL